MCGLRIFAGRHVARHCPLVFRRCFPLPVDWCSIVALRATAALHGSMCEPQPATGGCCICLRKEGNDARDHRRLASLVVCLLIFLFGLAGGFRSRSVNPRLDLTSTTQRVSARLLAYSKDSRN